ncbi:MAG: hypothetical protein ACREUO_07420 [Burkholderiales bacterium]
MDGKFEEAAVLRALGGIFDKPKKEAEGTPGQLEAGGWPEGFVLKGYIPCQWEVWVDNPHPDETMISFRAEIHHTLPRSLYENRVVMLKEVNWFYHYREYRWWRELKDRLNKANEALRTNFKQPCPPERIWFRDWQWYCGNGGC